GRRSAGDVDAAVDGHGAADDVVTGVGGEVDRGRSHVLGATDATRRDLRGDLVTVVTGLLVHGRGEGPGGDGADDDAFGGEADGHPLREVHDSGLARVVRVRLARVEREPRSEEHTS